MKKILLTCTLVCGFLFNTDVHSQRFDMLDDAPVDIAYLRADHKSPPVVKVVYSRPSKKQCEVFGGQVPYGEIWRTGANEATEITFYKDMLVGNKYVSAGTYVMHTIPGETDWTIIFNSNTDTWGAYFYNPDQDVVRIKVPSSQAEDLDIFSIGFIKSIKDSYMVLAWDTTRVNIPLAEGRQFLAKS